MNFSLADAFCTELETADRHSAVDDEHVTDDVTRLARSQPHGRGREFAGAPPRLAGMAVLALAANAGFCALFATTIGVSVKPGAKVLTRMLWAAFSIAATRVNPCTPCFEAASGAHATRPGQGGHRCGIDDGSAAGALHQRQLIFHA